MEDSKTVNRLAQIIAKLFYAIFGITFVYTSYRVFLICQEIHPTVWVACNILNGILGGVFLVYPLTAIGQGFTNMLYYWLNYFILLVVLIAFSLIISMALGMGGIDG